MSDLKLDRTLEVLIERLHKRRFVDFGEMCDGGSGSDAACGLESAISSFIGSVGRIYDLSELDLPNDEDYDRDEDYD